MELLEELEENQTILLLMPSKAYNQELVTNIKQLFGKRILYITLNKTYDSLKELFKKKGISTENIMFIDAISKTIKKVDESVEDCFYISSPGALTEISLALSKFLKSGKFDYLVFDSLTNLLIYQKKAPVAKFVSSLVNKIKATKTKAIFYALSVKEQEELIKEASMFVDSVIDLSK